MKIYSQYKIDTIIDGIKYNNPTEIGNYGFGLGVELSWKNENGKLNNENGPAFISYDNNGNIKTKEWWINGKCHNENGPSIIEYYPNGNIRSKQWYINDERHNENDPAYISYDQNGNIIKQEYWENGNEIK